MSQATRLKALAAELEAARSLVGLLESQRDALIAQDTERLDQVTASLQEQSEQFQYLAQTREGAFHDAADLGPEDIAFLQGLRAAHSQLQALAQLNQQIIADRLAYTRVLLGQLCPQDRGAGYAPVQEARTANGTPPASRMTRSA